MSMKLQSPLRLVLVRSDQHDPHLNLAVEERLMESVSADGRDCAFLYLWQNERTVVIGRHQNAWAECRVSLLEDEGGHLARRGSGGGAVYHDLGNLNFSIVMPRRLHDPARSSRMIVEAVRMLGVEAQLSGRNDILADGRKFSGNAFQLTAQAGLHHGTLLIATDFERVTRYLSVSKVKLESKGVTSVRSRITNLTELQPDVNVENACRALAAAFGAEYGESNSTETALEEIGFASLIDERCAELRARNASWAWRLGRSLPFQASMETRFSWGIVRIDFELKNGHVAGQALFSDMLDPDLPTLLTDCFVGCRYDPAELTRALDSILDEHGTPDAPYDLSRSAVIRDIQSLIADQMA